MKKNKSILLINSIKYVLLKKNIVQPNEYVIVAISGGQDSICLLIVFFILKNQWNLKLRILNCNHLWNKEALFIFSHLSKISFTLKIQISCFITLKSVFSEEKSRYWRSKNYFRLSIFTNSTTILTGHNLTDQIETSFFNMTRGCGVKGSSSLQLKRSFNSEFQNYFFISSKTLKDFIDLKKIFFSKKIKKNKLSDSKRKKYINNKTKISFFNKKKFLLLNNQKNKTILVRPLLIKTRFDIKNICSIWKLPVFPDQSNEKTKYSRNRLRKQLFPTLRFFFNPKLDFILAHYNELFLEEEKNNDYLTNKLFWLLLNENQTTFFINIALFCSLPLYLQRRVCFILFKEKLFLNFKFLTIDIFINIMIDSYHKFKKENLRKNKIFYDFFFPQIGTIYLSKNYLIIFK